MKLKYIIIGISLLSLLIACEEEIDIDLENAAPQNVIEASLIGNADSAIVLLSKSSDYFEPGNYPKIEGASVSITSGNGSVVYLNEIAPGRYTAGLPAQVNETYSLDVTIDENNYKATSVLKTPLYLDSLSYEENNTRFENNYILTAHFHDPEETKDHSRLNLFINGEENDNIFLYDDELSNGKNVGYSFVGARISKGDSVKVMIQTIDKPVYDYFQTLNEVAGNNNGFRTTVPDNPLSNIQGQALGYFSSYFESEKSIIIR